MRLEWHLDNWRRYMKAGEGILGYNGHSAGFVSGGNSRDFDDMVDAADMRCAKAVNTIIEGDLSPGQRIAIYNAYGLAVFRQRDPEGMLAAAKAVIERVLKAKGIF